MRKLNKTILAIILTIMLSGILSVSTTVTAFAVDDRDPSGSCYMPVPYRAVYNYTDWIQ